MTILTTFLVLLCYLCAVHARGWLIQRSQINSSLLTDFVAVPLPHAKSSEISTFARFYNSPVFSGKIVL